MKTSKNDSSEKPLLSLSVDSTQNITDVTQEDSEDVKEGGDSKKIPADKFNGVLLIMILQGFGALMAWNVFITIAPTYFREYKLKEANETSSSTNQPAAYVRNFMNYVCICSELPNLTVNAIALFIDKGNLFIRIIISLGICISGCLFTIIFIFIDVSSWPLGFFILTMVTVIILDSGSGVYQNSIYGIVGSFPSKYINAVCLGNYICGLIVTLILIATIEIFDDPRHIAIVYFSFAILVLIICTIFMFYVRRNAFYIYYDLVQRRASKERRVYSRNDYFVTFKKHWLSFFNIWAVCFVTFFLFPSVLIDIQLYPPSRHETWDFPVHKKLYGVIFVFLNLNLFSVVGCKLADFFKWPSKKYVVIPIVLRIIFIPIFYMSNYRPGGDRNAEVTIENEYVVFVFIALMSISHGYYSALSMMYAPSGVELSKSRIIGKMSAFFLVFGISCGIASSFLAEYPVLW